MLVEKQAHIGMRTVHLEKAPFNKSCVAYLQPTS